MTPTGMPATATSASQSGSRNLGAMTKRKARMPIGRKATT